MEKKSHERSTAVRGRLPAGPWLVRAPEPVPTAPAVRVVAVLYEEESMSLAAIEVREAQGVPEQQSNLTSGYLSMVPASVEMRGRFRAKANYYKNGTLSPAPQ